MPMTLFRGKIVLKTHLHRHCEPFFGGSDVGKGVAVSPFWAFPRLFPLKALPKPGNGDFFMNLG